VLEGLVREHPLRERLSPPAPRPAAPLSVTVAVPT